MASECESTLLTIHVPHLHGVIHGAREKEITGIMVCNLPHWLTMLSKGLGAACMDEVPDLDATVS